MAAKLQSDETKTDYRKRKWSHFFPPHEYRERVGRRHRTASHLDIHDVSVGLYHPIAHLKCCLEGNVGFDASQHGLLKTCC